VHWFTVYHRSTCLRLRSDALRIPTLCGVLPLLHHRLRYVVLPLPRFLDSATPATCGYVTALHTHAVAPALYTVTVTDYLFRSDDYRGSSLLFVRCRLT